MKCPVCREVALGALELQSNVIAQRCAACSGLWLSSPQFANWIASIPSDKSRGAAGAAAPATTNEPKGVKICPESGHLMSRYKVGPPLTFSLDRCGHCGGTWFDGNEWEILQHSELCHQVHLIFSPAWQARVRRAEQVRELLAQFAAKLGPLDFATVQRTKAWLDSHPHREAIIGYLISEQE